MPPDTNATRLGLGVTYLQSNCVMQTRPDQTAPYIFPFNGIPFIFFLSFPFSALELLSCEKYGKRKKKRIPASNIYSETGFVSPGAPTEYPS